jgi:hypothetical protein
VAPKVVVQIEGARFHETWNDPHMLDSREKQNGPQPIGELDGEKREPSEICGAIRLAAIPTPKWPTNMLPPLGMERATGPDPTGCETLRLPTTI